MSQPTADSSKYYLPHNSPLPILGSVALFTLMLGAASYLNGWLGGYAFLPGIEQGAEEGGEEHDLGEDEPHHPHAE